MSDKTILLVEDNTDDELLTVRAMKKSNIANHLVVVRDGAEALDYLFRAASQPPHSPDGLPALVLLDLKLPKVDGLQVLQRLRENELTKRLPIVVLTSSIEEHDLSSSYNFGANSYVRKPVDFNQFIDAVQQLGLYWLVLNQVPPS